MKRFVLIGDDSEPKESWLPVLDEADEYEDIEATAIALIREEFISWYRIIEVKAYDII